jgi:hypothetical protein
MKLLRALPLSLLLFATPAAADVVPPEVSACQGRVAGAACGGELGVPAGVCRDDTCTRLDYLNWNRDASASPPTMQYPCVRCVSPADGGSGDAGAPTPSQGGCAVGSSLGRRVGPWALVALVWAAFLGRKRRA